MSKSDGLWTDLNPVQQFLYYDGVWSNFFRRGAGNNTTYKLVPDTGIEPSDGSFTQISGGVLARW
jgi:hypothetical protein